MVFAHLALQTAQIDVVRRSSDLYYSAPAQDFYWDHLHQNGLGHSCVPTAISQSCLFRTVHFFSKRQDEPSIKLTAKCHSKLAMIFCLDTTCPV